MYVCMYTYTHTYKQTHTHTHTHTHIPQSYVSLLNSDDQSDIAQKIISEGLARVDKRKDRRLTKLVRKSS